MSAKQPENPTILVPYEAAACGGGCQDVFLYLRPETNGIEVESRLMRTVQANPVFRDAIELAYLANFPGEFIRRRRIVERHYHVRIFFAREGASGFTPGMHRTFSTYFGADSGEVEILGAFEALDRLRMDEAELFNLWVPPEDMIFICGQSVKRYRGLYIVNYDIPAILAKNSVDTDIAVMIFRTTLDYSAVHDLVRDIGEALQQAELLRRDMPLSRAFHYSKGPFEQILDAAGYLFSPDARRIPARHSSFFRYLLERGFTEAEIFGALNQPLMRFSLGGDRSVDEEIFAYTQDDSFEEAAEKLSRVTAQFNLPVNVKNISNNSNTV